MYMGSGTLPMALEQRVDILAPLEAQPEKLALAPEHRRFDRIGQKQRAAGARWMVGADLRQHFIGPEHAFDHHLDPPAAFLLADEPRLDHARVVEHHHVAGCDQPGDIAELPVGKRARPAVEMQQPAAAALAGGMLRDQFLRQLVVEIVETHPAIIGNA